jgi:hypothetical protein
MFAGHFNISFRKSFDSSIKKEDIPQNCLRVTFWRRYLYNANAITYQNWSGRKGSLYSMQQKDNVTNFVFCS